MSGRVVGRTSVIRNYQFHPHMGNKACAACDALVESPKPCQGNSPTQGYKASQREAALSIARSLARAMR